MNYDLNDEQKILKESARAFFAEELKSTLIRELEDDEQGYSQKLWEAMTEFGWMGPLIPEEYGGIEATFGELSVILEEMGYAGYAGPYFSTVVLGALTLLKAGTVLQKETLLQDISLGNRIVTLAWDETGDPISATNINATAVIQDNCYEIHGAKLFVPYAHIADTIICAARTGASGASEKDGISLFLIEKETPGVKIQVLDTIAKDKLCEVVFDHVRLPKEALIGELHQGWEVLESVLMEAAVAKCSEMVGGGRKVLEMIVEYAKTRKQFGSPIGSFQAIQHHCANMVTFLDSSALMTFYVCKLISQGRPHEKEAAMCKAWVSDAYRRLVALGHQVMGGVGFIEETDLQIYFRRAKAAELIFGDATYHREIVARHMGL